MCIVVVCFSSSRYACVFVCFSVCVCVCVCGVCVHSDSSGARKVNFSLDIMAMAAYLWRHGLMDKDIFIAEQGHGLGRPGQARVTRVGPAEAMTGILVAGKGFILMRGTVDLPTGL